MVSFRGQKKLEPRQDRSPLGGLIQNLRRASPPLSYAEFPPRAAEKTITLDFSTPTRLINRPCRVTPELSSSSSSKQFHWISILLDDTKSSSNYIMLNAPFHCFEQVIIFSKWKGRSLTWNRRSLLRVITLLLHFSERLRVVPHFSSGTVQRAKRERAWKSPHASTRARVSIALLSLRKNGGLLVVYFSDHNDDLLVLLQWKGALNRIMPSLGAQALSYI